MAPKKRHGEPAKKVKDLKPKASQVKGGMSQAERRLSDHRNEMRRNWAP